MTEESRVMEYLLIILGVLAVATISLAILWHGASGGVNNTSAGIAESTKALANMTGSIVKNLR
ncbi:MAG: hypothetical protein GXN93_04025 [Candidatus Diapherotrites archaeon]|nr:hypothetical protein [Candidatus Diapherotrites archaeon]